MGTGRARRRRTRATTSAFAGGRFTIERELGRGGMATVYLAHDRELDRPVAVKVLAERYAEDDEFVRRFRREARTAAGLAHPNIVHVYDAGEEDGRLFIVMEYVEGERLDAVLAREGPLPAARVADLGRQACAALAAAHERGVIHRDVKPGNLLVRRDGLLKVADFGIARAGDATQLTHAGTILGTAAYVAPEQARGEPVGPEADVFALGVVLYEVLAGSPPWRIETLAQLATVGQTPARPIREVAPATPPALEDAIMRCLAHDPRDRPRSAAALAAALEDRAPADDRTVPLEPATVPLTRRSRDARVERRGGLPALPARRLAPLLAAGAVVAALVVLLVLATGGGDERPPEPARVEPVPSSDDAVEQARNFEEWLREHTAGG